MNDWTILLTGAFIGFPVGVLIGVKIAERWYKPWINDLVSRIEWWSKH